MYVAVIREYHGCVALDVISFVYYIKHCSCCNKVFLLLRERDGDGGEGYDSIIFIKNTKNQRNNPLYST